MFEELLKFDAIKEDPFVIQNILWNKEPKDLMEAKFKKTDHGIDRRDEISGYIFYIETMGEQPKLFLMRHTAMDFADTVAQIDEIPDELLNKAIEENKAKHYFGMYPIDEQVKAWLKKELGVS